MRVQPIARRITALAALTVTATLALAACTSPNETGAQPTESGEGIQTIQFVNPLPNYPTWRYIGDCMAEAAEAAGLELTESGPTGSSLDTNYMIERIQQAIANNVDAIVTFPSNGELFGPVLQQARDKGILVATVQGSAAGAENVQVGTDWPAWGEMVAEKVAAEEGNQKVALLTTDPTPPSSDFADGFKDKATEFDNIEIVDERFTGGDVAATSGLVAAILTAHPDLTFIVGTEGAPIQAVTTAIREAGKADQVKYLPYGLDNGGKEGVLDGSVFATSVFDLCEIGTGPVDALVKISEGEELPALIPIPMDIATTENLDELLELGTWG